MNEVNEVKVPRAERVVVDLDATLGRLRGNRALLLRLIDVFLSGVDEQIVRLRAAVSSRDAEAITYDAHRLGSQVATFGADRANDAISAIRAAAEATDWPVASVSLSRLEGELAVLGEVLSSVRKTGEAR